jgi:hypothetical protein
MTSRDITFVVYPNTFSDGLVVMTSAPLGNSSRMILLKIVTVLIFSINQIQLKNIEVAPAIGVT